MHYFIVFPFFLKYLTNPKYMISNWPNSSKPTLTIPNNFLLHRQQVKYTFIYLQLAWTNSQQNSQTLIQHHPHLAPMEVCKQKFPIMWYFNVLPPLTNCHPRYTPTNWGEPVVALYCTIIFMFWHKDELWLDGLKIEHMKTQTVHDCNTKITQKGHQFIFTLLLQYTTYTVVIFTYFYHIISIMQF